MVKIGQERSELFKFLVSGIFAGSVFFTSDKFVNQTNTPKFYFTLAALLVVGTVYALMANRIKLISVFPGKTMLWGINIVCVTQACYGLFQFAGWLSSNSSKFLITGSFDNPAGFAAVLSLGFPIGIYLALKTNKIERYLSGTGSMVIALAVFLSNSRTGVLAILMSSFIFILFHASIISRLQQLRYYKLLSVSALAFLLPGSFVLYHQKKDSANGRLLIWEISYEMIKDSPICGHGYGAFQAKYMDYQAKYFKNNPASKYELLADNVKHPFNEFIKVAAEFGMIGLALIFLTALFVVWITMKLKNDNRSFVLSGLTSFLVFTCFSYPLQYISVWLLLAVYFSVLLPSEEIKVRNALIRITARSAVIIVFPLFLFLIFRQIEAEMKWKTIAMSSLRGNTKEMLSEYENLYATFLKRNPFFLYNYGAELNVAGMYDKSIEVLTECQETFNDYDLQMLLADNHYKNGAIEKTIQTYKYASNMIPCRFLPLYRLFEIYKNTGQRDAAMEYAKRIINKKVKIPSSIVSFIQSEAGEFIYKDEQ